MRWLLILVMAFAIGCATISPAAMPAFQDEFVIQYQPGWVAVQESGLVWNYYSQNMEKIAQCAMLSMDISTKAERWGGVYLKSPPLSFTGHRTTLAKTTDSLAECVEWVHFYLYGGYYI